MTAVQVNEGSSRGGVLASMSPLIAKALVVVASGVMIAIRAPHGQRSRSIPVVRSRKGRLEHAILTFALVAFFIPLIWVATPLPAFADYPLLPIPLAVGAASTKGLIPGIW